MAKEVTSESSSVGRTCTPLLGLLTHLIASHDLDKQPGRQQQHKIIMITRSNTATTPTAAITHSLGIVNPMPRSIPSAMTDGSSAAVDSWDGGSVGSGRRHVYTSRINPPLVNDLVLSFGSHSVVSKQRLKIERFSNAAEDAFMFCISRHMVSLHATAISIKSSRGTAMLFED